MRFVADESVDGLVVRALEECGHEVVSVAEKFPGAADEVVLRVAAERRAVLVTADKDFGELVFRRGLASSGVLLLRLCGCASPRKAELVVAAVVQRGEAMSGSFSVMTPRVLRIRKS